MNVNFYFNRLQAILVFSEIIHDFKFPSDLLVFSNLFELLTGDACWEHDIVVVEKYVTNVFTSSDKPEFFFFVVKFQVTKHFFLN